jgi:hypothetical protein
MQAQNIDIDITGDVLTLRGEKKVEEEKKEERYYCRERHYGSFQRSFRTVRSDCESGPPVHTKSPARASRKTCQVLNHRPEKMPAADFVTRNGDKVNLIIDAGYRRVETLHEKLAPFLAPERAGFGLPAVKVSRPNEAENRRQAEMTLNHTEGGSDNPPG